LGIIYGINTCEISSQNIVETNGDNIKGRQCTKRSTERLFIRQIYWVNFLFVSVPSFVNRWWFVCWQIVCRIDIYAVRSGVLEFIQCEHDEDCCRCIIVNSQIQGLYVSLD